jgi:hypothetical protein
MGTITAASEPGICAKPAPTAPADADATWTMPCTLAFLLVGTSSSPSRETCQKSRVPDSTARACSLLTRTDSACRGGIYGQRPATQPSSPPALAQSLGQSDSSRRGARTPPPPAQGKALCAKLAGYGARFLLAGVSLQPWPSEAARRPYGAQPPVHSPWLALWRIATAVRSPIASRSH